MSDQIRASHILVGHADASQSSSQLSAKDAMKQIESFKEQIKSGTPFEQVASDNSDCPSSRQGGDLGSFGRGLQGGGDDGGYAETGRVSGRQPQRSVPETACGGVCVPAHVAGPASVHRRVLSRRPHKPVVTR